MATLQLILASGQTDLHVRQFAVRESVSKTFTIDIMFRSSNHSLDFEGIVGQQIQLEALACGAGLDEAGLCAGFASVGGR